MSESQMNSAFLKQFQPTVRSRKTILLIFWHKTTSCKILKESFFLGGAKGKQIPEAGTLLGVRDPRGGGEGSGGQGGRR